MQTARIVEDRTYRNRDLYPGSDSYRAGRASGISTDRKLSSVQTDNPEGLKRSDRKKSLNRSRISFALKTTMFRTLFGGAFLLLLMIGITAYSVQINYSIVERENILSSLESEISNLNLEISREIYPASIEAKAVSMGMVRPSKSQQVYLEGTGAPNVAIANAAD